jgi:4-hydroxy-2-oxoglutarate aldolase
MSELRIRGVIPPMMTPFTESQAVDYDKHIQNMERWNRDDLAGYLVLGSNSEAAYLSEEEKIKLIELTVKHARKDRLILAGTGLESAVETIRLTNRAAESGAHGALLLTPSYYAGQMNDEALITYFASVADEAEIPVLIYNVPKFTNINVSVKVVRELSRHPNIVGMKDSTGNVPQLVSYLPVIAEGFNLIVGTVSSWFPALTLGIEAGIFALANLAPNECTRIQKAYEAGDLDTARETYMRLFPVNTAVTATYGVAGLKYASDLMGYQGGNVRSPLLPLKNEEKAAIRGILEAAGFGLNPAD